MLNYTLNNIFYIKILLIYIYIYSNKLLINELNPKKPNISIFLPIYNKEIYLENAIESLESQTFKNIEIVAVNDGSTDNSLKILKKLAKKYKNLKIVNNDRNHGLLYTRAMGILNSTGDYLMNLDPDDKLVSKNDLKLLYTASKSKKNDIILFLIKRIPVNKSDTDYFQYLDKNQLNMTDDHITNKLVKKEVFLKAFNDFKKEIFKNHWNFHEDNIWNYLVRKHAKSIMILNKYIYSYKRNSESLNMQMGNQLELKNLYYRMNKIKEITPIIKKSFEYHLFHDIKHYTILKNNEIRNYIFYVLVNYLEFFKNDKAMKNKINLVVKKLSSNKIIIIRDSSNIINKCFEFLNVYKKLKQFHKNVLTIYFKNHTTLANTIHLNDTIIILNNLVFNPYIDSIINEKTNNTFIGFINITKYNYLFNHYKNLKLMKC